MTASQNPQQPYSFDPNQAAAPQQWAPAPGGQPQVVYPAAPRNGLGITALCLGIVGILFGLIPFTGFVAFALGAVGVILGLVGFSRARKRVATNTKTAVSGTILSLVAIGLGIWGMVVVFTGLNQLSQDLNNLPAMPPAPTVGTNN